MSRPQARAVALVSGVILLLALLLRLVPPSSRLPAPDSLPPLSSARPFPVAAPGVGSDAYREVVDGNILSPTRQPPAVSAAPPGAVSPAPGESPRRPRTYRLSGIVQGPEGIIALIDADPRIPGAELYRLGDRVGPYRIVGASDSTIVLRGASGTQVLRLHSVPGRIQ